MWRVYKHTGKDKDYDAYKEALNAATNEVRKSTINCEHKLAQNIKSDSKIIRDHMMDFLIKHKLINPSQHGFLKARSCLTNVLCFFEEITKWVDEGHR